MKRMFVTTVTLLVALGGIVHAAEQGASTAEELVEKLNQAGTSQRLVEMAPLLHPEDRPMMGTGLLMAAQMVASYSGSEGTAIALDTILSRHGVSQIPDLAPNTTPAQMKTIAANLMADVDVVALVSDLEGFLAAHGGTATQRGDGTATGLKVDGDRATVTVGGQTVFLEKHEGRWYVRMDFTSTQ